ncbi:L,D-transpeptidase family protein [Gemmobacter serpentinus]|uniref:L,D-transpeptidase family protein n=1 Tax=Gemmobacter serpentinus TaxID=2652247 RepID=UPI00124E6100|nr:L,D-transpeptidase family protein [Gemmobacter serpentinus]
MDLIVTRQDQGWQARFGDRVWQAGVGRSGIAVKQIEGDGVSPIGCWPIRRVLYRADKLDAAPVSVFPTAEIAADDGWCDAPNHPDYNRPVKLPFAASHEEMWRKDDLYDIVVVLGQNDDPVIPGAGSAVFLHIASAGYGSTAGCATLTRADLLEFLSLAQADTRLCFQA